MFFPDRPRIFNAIIPYVSIVHGTWDNDDNMVNTVSAKKASVNQIQNHSDEKCYSKNVQETLKV